MKKIINLNTDRFKLIDHNGEEVLMKNDQVCQCPFRNPVILPSKIHGQIEMRPPVCSTACQFFTVNIDSEQTTVSLHCVNFTVTIKG
jgi:hypothetical protein